MAAPGREHHTHMSSRTTIPRPHSIFSDSEDDGGGMERGGGDGGGGTAAFQSKPGGDQPSTGAAAGTRACASQGDGAGDGPDGAGDSPPGSTAAGGGESLLLRLLEVRGGGSNLCRPNQNHRPRPVGPVAGSVILQCPVPRPGARLRPAI